MPLTNIPVDWEDEQEPDLLGLNDLNTPTTPNNNNNHNGSMSHLDHLEQEFQAELNSVQAEFQGLSPRAYDSSDDDDEDEPLNLNYTTPPQQQRQPRASLDPTQIRNPFDTATPADSYRSQQEEDDSLFWAEEDAGENSYTFHSNSDPFLSMGNSSSNNNNNHNNTAAPNHTRRQPERASYNNTHDATANLVDVSYRDEYEQTNNNNENSNSRSPFAEVPLMGSGDLPRGMEGFQDNGEDDAHSFESDSSQDTITSDREAMPEWQEDNPQEAVLPEWNKDKEKKLRSSSRRKGGAIGGNLMSDNSKRKRMNDSSKRRSMRASSSNNNNMPDNSRRRSQASSLWTGGRATLPQNQARGVVPEEEEDPLLMVDKTPNMISNRQSSLYEPPEGQPQPPRENSNNSKRNSIRSTMRQDWNAWWIGIVALCCCCGLLVLAVMLPLYFLVLKDNDNDNNDKDRAIPAPLFILPLPDYTIAALKDNVLSPQARAYDWLSKDPELETYSEPRKLQRFALATVFYGLRGENWTTSATQNWLDYEISECQWGFRGIKSGFHTKCGSVLTDNAAVAATKEHQVNHNIFDNKHSLRQRKRQLQLPPTSLDLGGDPMMHIMNLEIVDNNAIGTLPPEIQLLSELRTLDLSNNVIFGSIPSELTTLQHLVNLKMPFNRINGSLPWISSPLETINLSHNELNSTLPAWLGSISTLGELDLSHNQLKGSLLEGIQLWGDSLTALRLHVNQLTGQMPNQVGFLSNLRVFEVDHNLLNGTLPTQIGAMVLLEELVLNNNTFSGPIPTQIGKLTELRAIKLGGNELSEEIPSEIGVIASLEELWLYDNDFTGTIPEQVANLGLKSLRFAILFDNEMTGVVPDDLCEIEELQFDCEELCGCNCPCDGDNATEANVTDAMGDSVEEQGSEQENDVDTADPMDEPAAEEADGIDDTDPTDAPDAEREEGTDVTEPPMDEPVAAEDVTEDEVIEDEPDTTEDEDGEDETTDPQNEPDAEEGDDASTDAPDAGEEDETDDATTDAPDAGEEDETDDATMADPGAEEEDDTINDTIDEGGDENPENDDFTIVSAQGQTVANGTVAPEDGAEIEGPDAMNEPDAEENRITDAFDPQDESLPPDHGQEERYGIRSVNHAWDSEVVTLSYQLSDYILDDSVSYKLYDGLGCRTNATDITGTDDYFFMNLRTPQYSQPDLSNNGLGSRGPFELHFTLNKGQIADAPFFSMPLGLNAQLSFCVGLSVSYNKIDGWTQDKEVNAIETAIQLTISLSDFGRIDDLAIQTIVQPEYNRIRVRP